MLKQDIFCLILIFNNQKNTCLKKIDIRKFGSSNKKKTQFVTERESPYTCKIFITTFFLFSDIKIYSFYDMSSETNGSIIGVTGNVSSLDDHKPITFIFFN